MDYKKTYEYKEALKARLCGLSPSFKEVSQEDEKNNATSMAEMYQVGKEKYKEARSFGFSHLQALLIAKKK